MSVLLSKFINDLKLSKSRGRAARLFHCVTIRSLKKYFRTSYIDLAEVIAQHMHIEVIALTISFDDILLRDYF